MDKVNFSKRKFEFLSTEHDSDQLKVVTSHEMLLSPNCQNDLSVVTNEQAHNSSSHQPLVNSTPFCDELDYIALLDQFNLLEACCKGDLKLVRQILSENESHYRDINQIMTNAMIDEKISTPLITAAKNGYLSIVQCLIDEYGANVNAIDMKGNDALINACERGQMDVAQFLVSKGSNLNWRNFTQGTSALFHAVLSDNTVLVKYLLQNGAEINVQDNLGNTPLMYAAERDLISMVETLLKYEPDMVVKNQKGKEAYRLATSREVKDLIQEKVIEHRQKQANKIALQQAQLRLEQQKEKEKRRMIQQQQTLNLSCSIPVLAGSELNYISHSLSTLPPMMMIPALQSPHSSSSTLLASRSTTPGVSEWKRKYQIELQLRLFAEGKLLLVEQELQRQQQISHMLEEHYAQLLEQQQQHPSSNTTNSLQESSSASTSSATVSEDYEPHPSSSPASTSSM